MTHERLKEIEENLYRFTTGSSCFMIENEDLMALITFARSTLASQPVPCDHAEVYSVSHVSDQIVTICNGCMQVMEVSERKGDKWVTVWKRGDPDEVVIIPIKSGCKRCGKPCEECSK